MSISGIYTADAFGDFEFPIHIHEREQDVVGFLGERKFTGIRKGSEIVIAYDPTPLKSCDPESLKPQSPVNLNLRIVDGKLLTEAPSAGCEANGEKSPIVLSKREALPKDFVFEAFDPSELIDIKSVICPLIEWIFDKALEGVEAPIADSLRPMSVCGLERSGRGYWILGNEAPGDDIPVFMSTMYAPVSLGDGPLCGVPSPHLGFGFNLGDSVVRTVEDVVNAILQDACSLLRRINIDIGWLVAKIRELENLANFAFSIIYNPYTRSLGIVFNNAAGLTTNNLNSYPAVASIMGTLQTFLKSVPGVESIDLYAGEQVFDRWHGKHSWIPGAPVACWTPYLVTYLFGTANVSYM